MAQAKESSNVRAKVRIYVVPGWALTCGHTINAARCRAEVQKSNGPWQCGQEWRTMVPGKAAPRWRMCEHHAGIAITRGIIEPEGAQ